MPIKLISLEIYINAGTKLLKHNIFKRIMRAAEKLNIVQQFALSSLTRASSFLNKIEVTRGFNSIKAPSHFDFPL